MAQFNVYKKDRDSFDPEYRAIKDGYSFPGMFFTVIWAFVKKLWVLGFILIGVIFLYSIITTLLFGDNAGDKIANFLGLALAAYVGFKGNDILGKDLLKRGYTLVGLYEGNRQQAIDKAKNKMPVADNNKTIYNNQDLNKIKQPNEVICQHCNEKLLLDENEMKSRKYVCAVCNKEGTF